MPTERTPMQKIRDILRLKWTLQRPHREVARSLGISLGAVGSVMIRASAKSLTWDAVSAMTDDALEQTLYGPRMPTRRGRPEPDPVWIHTELRGVGVTLELLHLEYLAGLEGVEHGGGDFGWTVGARLSALADSSFFERKTTSAMEVVRRNS